MKIFTKQGQLTIDEMKGSLSRLPKDNRWVQMGDSLPWAEFEKVYNKNLKNDKVGANNRPGRMVIGALIIKHKLGLSDEETIEIIKENPYMQYMCGLEEYSSEALFDPSLFVTIRKRISIKDINEMTVAMAREAAEKKNNNDDDNGQAGGGNAAKTQPTDIKVDATCADAEVRYPTDMDLVEDGSRYIDRMIDKACGHKGIRKIKTERNRIRKEYLKVIKRKHKGAKLIKNALSQMLPLLYRDILAFINLVGMDEEIASRFNRTQWRTIQTVIEMYHQQDAMHRNGTHSCPGRIVSIHQPHVRPMVRGKASARVEFGAKIGVSVVNGYSYIDNHSWDAYNESSDLKTHLDNFKERFGDLPKRFFGDKIYLNRENRKLLREKGIEIMGSPLGRPPRNPTEEQLEKERVGVSLRNEAEAQFGTGKRVYRANDIRAKLPETADCWTAMCYFVKNVTKFMRELCRVLTEICRFLLHFDSKSIYKPILLCQPVRMERSVEHTVGVAV